MKHKNYNKKGLKFYRNYILVALCGILVILNVIVAIDGATSGSEIAQIQKQEAQLADQKKVLQDKLVTGLSMGNLQEKSSELGFVKPENPIYLSGASAVAKLP